VGLHNLELLYTLSPAHPPAGLILISLPLKAPLAWSFSSLSSDLSLLSFSSQPKPTSPHQPQVAAAAEIIEWAVSNVPWVTTDAFVSCMRESKGAILAITGPGDPTGQRRNNPHASEKTPLQKLLRALSPPPSCLAMIPLALPKAHLPALTALHSPLSHPG
jgi:hypothetical protein